MNGAQHYRQAEILMSDAREADSSRVERYLHAAQVHAILALTAAVVDSGVLPPGHDGWGAAIKVERSRGEV